jgi:hypothetical protein
MKQEAFMQTTQRMASLFQVLLYRYVKSFFFILRQKKRKKKGNICMNFEFAKSIKVNIN